MFSQCAVFPEFIFFISKRTSQNRIAPWPLLGLCLILHFCSLSGSEPQCLGFSHFGWARELDWGCELLSISKFSVHTNGGLIKILRARVWSLLCLRIAGWVGENEYFFWSLRRSKFVFHFSYPLSREAGLPLSWFCKFLSDGAASFGLLHSHCTYHISIFIAFNEYANVGARIISLSNTMIIPIMDITIWIATFIAYEVPPWAFSPNRLFNDFIPWTCLVSLRLILFSSLRPGADPSSSA